MPRMTQVAVGNTIYHVINRENRRVRILHTDVENISKTSNPYDLPIFKNPAHQSGVFEVG